MRREHELCFHDITLQSQQDPMRFNRLPDRIILQPFEMETDVIVGHLILEEVTEKDFTYFTF